MLYYFVSPDGDFVDQEGAPKDWFQEQNNPDMFTQKRDVKKEQKRRLKARISELQQILKELK